MRARRDLLRRLLRRRGIEAGRRLEDQAETRVPFQTEHLNRVGGIELEIPAAAAAMRGVRRPARRLGGEEVDEPDQLAVASRVREVDVVEDARGLLRLHPVDPDDRGARRRCELRGGLLGTHAGRRFGADRHVGDSPLELGRAFRHHGERRCGRAAGAGGVAVVPELARPQHVADPPRDDAAIGIDERVGPVQDRRSRGQPSVLVDLEPAVVEPIDARMVQIEDRVEGGDLLLAHQAVAAAALGERAMDATMRRRLDPGAKLLVGGGTPSRSTCRTTPSPSPALPLLHLDAPRLHPQRVRHRGPVLVHVGGIAERGRDPPVRRVVPVGQRQVGVARGLPEHALEVEEEHPVPGQELRGVMLALAPGRGLVRVRGGPERDAGHAVAADRPAAAAAEMAMHVRPVDPAPAEIGAAARGAVARHHRRDPAPKRHELGRREGRDRLSHRLGAGRLAGCDTQQSRENDDGKRNHPPPRQVVHGNPSCVWKTWLVSTPQ